MMDIASITRIVEESFPDSVRPAEDDLFEVNDGNIPEFMDMIEGKDWRGFLHVLETVEFSMKQYYGQMVVYMTQEAFHYFAPALLIFSMNEEADVVAVTFFGRLYPRPEIYDPNPDPFPQLLELFSDQQKHAIALVVDHCTSDGAMLLLRSFWAPWMDC